MAPHSRVPAWRIPWTEEPGGLQSTGSQRVGQAPRAAVPRQGSSGNSNRSDLPLSHFRYFRPPTLGGSQGQQAKASGEKEVICAHHP